MLCQQRQWRCTIAVSELLLQSTKVKVSKYRIFIYFVVFTMDGVEAYIAVTLMPAALYRSSFQCTNCFM